jgi:hypothetical protein
MEGGARVSGAHLQDKIRGALGAHVVQAGDTYRNSKLYT